MRIDELRLLAFGPFTDRRLGFERGTEGVHVVFGANEAGKSSALRAIRDALYGIPMRSPDGFLHPYKSLRIGISLRSAAGQALAAVRRKGQRTLFGADSEQPLDETALEGFLAGIDRDSFGRMFGLDQETLRAGGREIALMKGVVGGTLFSAAGGLVHLRRLRESLDDEAGEIYLQKSPKKPLNAALAELDSLKTQVREDRKSSRDYREKNEQLDRERAQADDLSRRLRDCRRRQNLVERMIRSVPLIDQLRGVREEIATLAGTQVLRAGFAEDVRKASDAVLAADARVKGAKQAVDTIDDELRTLPRPGIAEPHWPLAQRLANELGAYRKACGDLPGLRRAVRSKRAELAPRIERLRPGLELEDYERLFISPVDRGTITGIGRRLTTAAARESSTADDLKRAAEALTTAESDLSSLASPLDTRTIDEALRAARARGDVEDEHAKQRRRCEADRETLRRELARAGRWTRSLEDLCDVALPGTATLDAHEAALNEVETASKRARELHTNLDAEHSRLTAELAALLAAEGDLPTEEHVAAARGARDRLWAAIRGCWLGAGTEVRDDSGQAADPRDLPAAGSRYESLVAGADDVVDRVRREHARVAQRARLESDIRSRHTAVDKAAKEVGEADAERSRARAAWRKVWEQTGIDAGTPREMRDWLAIIGTLRARRDALDEAERATRELASFIADRKAAIAAALKAVGVVADEPGSTLGQLMARCDRVIEEQGRVRDTRTTLETAAAKARERRKELTGLLEARRDELAKVKAEWEQSLADAGVPLHDDTTEADTWMTECMDVYAQAHQLLGPDGTVLRIKGIEQNQKAFIEQVADVLRKIGDDTRHPDLDNVEDIATDVLGVIDHSRQRAAAVADAEKRRQAATSEWKKQSTEADAARARITALAQEVAADPGADLAALCKRSDTLRELRTATKTLEDGLRQLAGNESLPQWEEMVSAARQGDLEQDLADLAGTAETLDGEKTEADRRVGGLRKELDAIGTGTTAVTLNTRIQGKLAEIESFARDYARKWIASQVLRRAVDAYRERNQGEFLGTAGDYFARLTEGAFGGLTVDYTDETAVIAGRRAGHPTPVHVDEMSEGTTDQLFLAIRLAYLDIRARTQEPLPLILDDVLGTYDDARAAATLKTLAEFSRKTQVILFTHHRHLLAIAEKSVPAGTLFVQELSA